MDPNKKYPLDEYEDNCQEKKVHADGSVEFIFDDYTRPKKNPWGPREILFIKKLSKEEYGAAEKDPTILV